MEALEFLGQGVCHQDPGRSPDDTWLCHRCTGLYLGGLLGLSGAPALARSAGLGLQLLLCGAMLLPITVDGIVLGRGSPLDVPWFRVATGVLAGIGSGLFLGARGWEAVRWPGPLGAVRRPWIPIWLWVAAGLGAYLAGWPLLLDAAVAAGLLGLCMAGAAWGWRLAVAAVRRVRRGFPTPRPTPKAPAGAVGLPVGWVILLALAGLCASAAVPAAWKPTTSWIWISLDWIRGGGGT